MPAAQRCRIALGAVNRREQRGKARAGAAGSDKQRAKARAGTDGHAPSASLALVVALGVLAEICGFPKHPSEVGHVCCASRMRRGCFVLGSRCCGSAAVAILRPCPTSPHEPRQTHPSVRWALLTLHRANLMLALLLGSGCPRCGRVVAGYSSCTRAFDIGAMDKRLTARSTAHDIAFR